MIPDLLGVVILSTGLCTPLTKDQMFQYFENQYGEVVQHEQKYRTWTLVRVSDPVDGSFSMLAFHTKKQISCFLGGVGTNKPNAEPEKPKGEPA